MERRLLWCVTGKQRRAGRKGPPKRVSFRASTRSAKRETKEDGETLMAQTGVRKRGPGEGRRC